MGKQKRYREYKRGQVVYVDFGWQPNGVQGFLHPAVVVTSVNRNKEYHYGFKIRLSYIFEKPQK